MKIVMIGIVGAGKGTQAKKLAEFLRIPHISTGDIFRDAAEKRTDFGVKAQKIMKEGKFIPDDIVLGIVKDRISQEDVKDGYILDGFPRTITQAEEFDKLENLDRVFYITIPEEEVIRRLRNRQREDDTEDTIKARIKIYYKQTKPLIDYYRKKHILNEIDGNRKIDEIFEDIRAFV